MFHLDEYIGIPSTHPASFRKYLQERLIDKVHPGAVHFIQGDASEPNVEVKRISNLILKDVIDVAFIGIGENGHIAFNDPPADFETEDPYIIVKLDEKCRQQQVNEGWFANIDEVPQTAISMSVKQIIKSNMIICTCPDKRKAIAVKNCLSTNSIVTPLHPASILKLHPQTHIFLDRESASLL
jgi:glucosamine-6-phosphate deaminase